MSSVGESIEDPERIEIRLMLEAIHARYGYDLRSYAPQSIERRCHAALRHSEAAHFGELQHRLLHDRDFFADVFESLTGRVSEPFRDPDFYRAYRERVVPLLRTYPFVKIWHAGCASGEEAYSMSILMREEQLDGRTQIHATDLSPRAISHAKEGVYSADIMDAFEKNHRASGGTSNLAEYLTIAYEQVAMRESLRKSIVFFQHDLSGDHVFGEMNVIFCRNVLIYFTRDLQERVLAKLAQSLCPGGFLCLGASERLPASPVTAPFTPFDANARIYRFEP